MISAYEEESKVLHTKSFDGLLLNRYLEICPDGKLRSGRQGRYLLASAETLHEENKALKLRIRALEQALESSSQTKSSHPLLEPRLLSIARPYLSEETTPAEPPKPNVEESLVNRFGTMHIDYGKDKWLGVSEVIPLIPIWLTFPSPHRSQRSTWM